jgi:hypothetical protein
MPTPRTSLISTFDGEPITVREANQRLTKHRRSLLP